jgi:TFIIF-interacting CTD phosphatase-like protein
METVGEILDTLKFSVKMLFVEDCVIASGTTLLNEIFQLLPVPWNQDPVKVRERELHFPLAIFKFS